MPETLVHASLTTLSVLATAHHDAAGVRQRCRVDGDCLRLRWCFVITQEIAEAVSLTGRVCSDLAVITDDVRCQEDQQIDLVTITPVGTEEVSNTGIS